MGWGLGEDGCLRYQPEDGVGEVAG
jgi:hypothetical protein